MPELTPHLGLKKPSGNERVARANYNENLDILDANSPLNKLDGTTAPTVNDDQTKGYSPGSLWVDAANKKAYVCTDATEGTAIWEIYTGLTAHLADNAPNPRGNQIYHVEVVSSSGSETPEQGRIIFDMSQGKFFGGNGSGWV